MRGTKLYAMLAAMFMAGAFLASPDLRAYASTIANDVICTGCVGTSDIAGNAITSAKIKDGEVKTADIANGAANSAKIVDNSITAADLAPDSVGGSELQGVTKLLFGECVFNSAVGLGPGTLITFTCAISGVDGDDFAVATLRAGNGCYEVAKATPFDGGSVLVSLRNECPTTQTTGAGTIAVIVYDK